MARRSPELEASEQVAPGGDPGKEARAAAGIPVIPSMDGFRAFAIAGVIAFHLILLTGVPTSSVARVAYFGTLPNLVDALFIISGFVVFLPTVARGGDFGPVGAFALRRAARLLPAYGVAVLLSLVFVAAWPTSPAPGGPFGLYEIAAHLSFLHMPILLVDHDFNLGLSLNGPLWTLSEEITFYLLLPFVARAWCRRPLVGLLIAAAVTFVWKESLIHISGISDLLGIDSSATALSEFALAASNQFPAWAFSFGLGMTAAWCYVRASEPGMERRVLRWAPVGQLVSLAAFALSAYLLGRYALKSDLAFLRFVPRRDPAASMFFSASLTALMLSTALAPHRLQRPFNLSSARALGDISYGMYLIHAPLSLFLIALLPGMIAEIGALPALLITAVPLTVAYGWASARLLEQPIRRWARRYGRRASAEAPPLKVPRADE